MIGLLIFAYWLYANLIFLEGLCLHNRRGDIKTYKSFLAGNNQEIAELQNYPGEQIVTTDGKTAEARIHDLDAKNAHCRKMIWVHRFIIAVLLIMQIVEALRIIQMSISLSQGVYPIY